MSEQTSWDITPKGQEVADRMYLRFTTTTDTIEEIAADEGFTEMAARILIFIAQNGGMVTTTDD